MLTSFVEFFEKNFVSFDTGQDPFIGAYCTIPTVVLMPAYIYTYVMPTVVLMAAYTVKEV